MLEDDSGVVDVLSVILEEAGYYVSTTARVNDATQMLERSKVDLFIADILLPDGTAFPAIDEAKKRNIPYLLITGSVHHMAQLEANGISSREAVQAQGLYRFRTGAHWPWRRA